MRPICGRRCEARPSSPEALPDARSAAPGIAQSCPNGNSISRRPGRRPIDRSADIAIAGITGIDRKTRMSIIAARSWLLSASLLVGAGLAGTAVAAPTPRDADILVTAQPPLPSIENPPSSRVTITGDSVAKTTNAVNVEDALKYLPSLLVRKRHSGDTQAPLATRTSGLGASARSLVYADGALLSALIGNNNTSASPRWSLVSPQEIDRIDVLYGPFSAAYPGNSIGAVVNITTRMPDKLEATANAAVQVQNFDQYGTSETLPTYQFGATIGDRFGPLALFASADHVVSNGQPLLYVTASPAGTGGTPSNGGFDDVNRLGMAIKVLGASGMEHQVEDQFKLKVVLDISSGVRLSYVAGLFLNDTDAGAETYLRNAATGLPVYAGTLNIGGQKYTVPAGAFSAGVYRYRERHWSHVLALNGNGDRFDWQVIGTLYDIGQDIQQSPTTALPAARDGGAGTISKFDGTGWKTFDAKGLWRLGENAAHSISFGIHGDWFRLNNNRFATTDWIGGAAGPLNLRSKGRTRTLAVWAQDGWKPLPGVTLTLGGRYEWWRATDGENFSIPMGGAVFQPGRSAHRFSPKATLAWQPQPAWTVRLSFGQAWRFPTVGELYQIVTSPFVAVPNPYLRPERARSEELAIEHNDAHGLIRLSLFNEQVKDALISQLGNLNGLPATFVQNVDRTRARGVELAFQRSDILPRFDLSGSITYADATTRRNAALPAAVGKLLPQVPHWKATLVGTWRPVDHLSLTAAMRYASRNFGTIDNSDRVGNTFQGFYKYLVVDLRAELKLADHWTLGVGVDNLTNDRYFLFHPFPQRSFAADLKFRL
jgi:iron complex outermembrane receptor protein